MDSVLKYREKRIKRLEKRFGTYHGSFRLDADEEESNNGNNNGNSFHGNTRIPFGLCQREGIQIEKDWTPKDAWDALAGKGYSAGEVYTELKKTGKVAPRKPKAPEKTPAELKKLHKDFTTAKKELKKREKLEKEKSTVQEGIKACENRAGWYDHDAKRAREKVAWFIEKYGSEEAIPSVKDPNSHDIYPPYTYYEMAKDDIKRDEKWAKDERDMIEVAKKKIEGLDEQINALKTKEDYTKAADELLKHSPYTEKVKSFRAIEEEAESDRKSLAYSQDQLEKFKWNKSYFEQLRQRAADAGEQDVVEFYESHGIAASKLAIEKYEKKVEELSKKVGEYDKRLSEVKADASDKDWKQIYDLSIERDTVVESDYEHNGFKDASKKLKSYKVKYSGPVKYASQPSDERIISDLCGPDKTGGSCVSVAFAYIANKAGYRVLDFRGASSRETFSTCSRRLVRELGGEESGNYNGFESAHKVLNSVQEGKEYYFVAGSHATIVRKNEGNLEYLELQDNDGGWHSLDDSVLKNRYACKSKRTHYGRALENPALIIETSKLAESKDFISLMGYINTAEEKQKKGKGGGMK